MTPKRALFAEHYALDHNGAAAAVRAGYAKRSARQIATRLMANADVQGLIVKYEAEASRRLGLTKERVIEGLQAAIAEAKLQGDPMAQIRGWVQVGKMIGAYAPERKHVEISIDGHALRLKFAAMSDAELLALIEEPELEA